MKRIAYIILYFGNFPDTFELWLESARNNESIDFHIYTDNIAPDDCPDNVFFHAMTFAECRSLLQSKFPEIEIALKAPYKLCDFKPAYGYVFSDMLVKGGYDFWGYCDIDLVFGNISKFITDDVLNKFSKIGFLGHSSLFRNNDEMNSLFRTHTNDGIDYKDVFSDISNKPRFFDEDGISRICKQKNIQVYKKVIFADISPLYWNFHIGYQDANGILKNKCRIFLRKKDQILSYSLVANQIVIEEFMYAHFLRRHMVRHVESKNTYLIVPNKFLPAPLNISKDLIQEYGKNRVIFYWVTFMREKWRKITPKRVIRYVYDRVRVSRDGL